jgi:putative aldouronate transport system substrate-binding protein
MNAINAASQTVDKSLEYMQFINTNREYRDHLRYGIQGTNWEYVNDGKSVKKLDSAYEPWGFAQGSFFVMTPEDPITADVWDRVKAVNDGAAETADDSLFGFAFDHLPVEATIAACKTVVDKYKAGLRTGATDPATEIPALMEELKAAGIDDIVAECQKQVDAYIAAYGD